MCRRFVWTAGSGRGSINPTTAGEELLSDIDRRQHVRVPLQGTVTVSTSTGDIRAEITNISEGGLGLLGSRTGSPGEFVRVRFELPSGTGKTTLNPDAVIARAVQVGEQWAWALQFLSLDAKGTEAIRSYVAHAQANPAQASVTGRLPSDVNDRQRAVQDLLRRTMKKSDGSG